MAVLILLQAFLVSLGLIVAPLKRLALEKFTILYFGFIGAAFMFVEIALMQQFILFLGQPTYSVTIVLFSLLLFSGVGSSISQEVCWRRGFFFLCLVLFLLIVGGYSLIHTFLGLNLTFKVAVSIGVLAPLSFFMGMPFPTGIAVLNKNQVPYAWCVNGCSSVCSSVLSVMVALSLGFRFVLFLGLVLYGLAFLVRMKSR